MKTLSISYPESLLTSLHVSEGEFAREARMAMAVKLFDTGRLSSGQAADLADMPRVHFLYELGRWGVSALQTSEDELESDLNVARTLHDRHQHQPRHSSPRRFAWRPGFAGRRDQSASCHRGLGNGGCGAKNGFMQKAYIRVFCQLVVA